VSGDGAGAAGDAGELWVTGVGLVTPLGIGVEATWSRLCAGERAIRPIERFSASGQRAAMAAEVGDAPGVVVQGPAESRTSAMASTAAAEAMRAARLDPRALRVGLVIGSTTGGMLETEQLLAKLHSDPDSHDALAAMLSHPLTATGDRLCEQLGPFTRVRMLSSACSSGANALVVAAGWLQLGEVDAVVAGGTDGLCRLTLSGFNALAALDPEPCRPFDRGRRGTSLGEGAGFLVLERAASARRRSVTPVAALVGWASGSEAHHITNPDPDGSLVASLVTRALSRAGLTPEQVDYVNAHGTGTPANDRMEAAALARALGPELARIPVSSCKAQIGHCLGAAGAIEAVITALVVQRRTLVPTVGIADPDLEMRLVHVRDVGRPVPRVRSALSSSFGFGGMDTVLVFSEPRGEARTHATVPDVPAQAPRSVVVTGVAYAAGHQMMAGSACGIVPAAPVEGALDLDALVDPARARRLDRYARLGVVSVEAALRDAGVEDPATGLVLGSAFGNVDGSAAFMHRIFDKGPRAASPADFPSLVPSAPVGHASIYLGLRGPAFATADLGTSGESAFVQAVQLVASGEAECMVAGALEPRSRIVERVLRVLFALVTRSAAHTARGHADVSAAVVLEDETHARQRSGRILARVAQTLEWRDGLDDAVARLRAPASVRPEVVLAGGSEGADAVLARTAWKGAPRLSCAAGFGDSDGLGAVALAVAAARVSSGLATDALVVGLDERRGYFLVLSAAE
jgi:3-oxoacyl-[acyl-carrier-protein] synthase II